MGLQWQLVAFFLYFEVALVFLLCLEFISPTRWKKIFNSRFVTMLKSGASTSFYTLLCVLVLLFADSINRMLKYRALYNERKAAPNFPVGGDPGAQMFLAQRNIYITGFALFLLVIVNRLMKLLSQLASATAREEAALQQARGASTQSEKLLEENADLRKGKSASSKQEQVDTESLHKELKEKSAELQSAKASLEAIRSQAESTNREYDRLLKEHSNLQSKVGGSDKKTD